jgi:hypothetical protein
MRTVVLSYISEHPEADRNGFANNPSEGRPKENQSGAKIIPLNENF